ncbi:hypothetical protein [Alteromonas alba]|uniref:hypothetical protein n=1 Tax=Alteromonas alba TaxID=2079529 RepID=UPI000D0161A2|nr:hypothetical protein [Alteromonas alba]
MKTAVVSGPQLKQHNRVQLSFPSIVKIFAVFAISLDLFFCCFYALFLLLGIEAPAPGAFFVVLVAMPLLFILFATLGYPFFALLNRIRGGLFLTELRGKAPCVGKS